mgnify:FL=1
MTDQSTPQPDIQSTLDAIHTRLSQQPPADTMHPTMQLVQADPNWFAIAIVTSDGQTYSVGDAEQLFPLQSMSKPFSYGLALQDHGREYVLTRIGVEPTGRRYNAIVLDEATGRPYNPMVNAGAIAVADIIEGDDLSDKLRRLFTAFGLYIGRALTIDAPTFTFELQTDHRNRAIAHLMRSSDMLKGSIDDALHLYFQHCAMLINTVELATMAATLANNGKQPFTGQQALETQYVRDVLSVMYTCGMYDSSGEWAYTVGLPAKSGISGGVMAVLPGRMGIAAFSPSLNDNGHSIRGFKAFQALSQALKLHIFAPQAD